jgi:hypothetical protein
MIPRYRLIPWNCVRFGPNHHHRKFGLHRVCIERHFMLIQNLMYESQCRVKCVTSGEVMHPNNSMNGSVDHCPGRETKTLR